MANRYLRATGNWNGPVWAATESGAAGSAATPTADDSVQIAANFTVTLTADAVCANVEHTSGTLTLSSYALDCKESFTSTGSTTRTINLGSGTLIIGYSLVSIGNVFSLTGSNLNFNAGTSLIRILANSRYNPPIAYGQTINTLSKTFNDLRLEVGYSAYNDTNQVNITGSPTFRLLDIRSANSAAHTVNFDGNINTQKFIAIGSSSSNRLSIAHGGTGGTTFSIYNSSYGQFVNMRGDTNINVNPGPESSYNYTKAYIGVNSVSTYSDWLLQNPPKISTLVDPLTTAPGSNPNWTVTGTVSQVTTGSGGGGYIVSSGKLVSVDTYDFVDGDIMFELPETTVGAYPVALTIGVNEVPGGLDPIYPTPGLLAAVTRLNDAAMMIDSAYSGWRGGSSSTSLTDWYNYEDIVPKKYYKIRVNSSTNKVEVRSSTDGVGFSPAANLDIQSGTLEMFKSARLVVDAVQRGGAGTPIGSINVIPNLPPTVALNSPANNGNTTTTPTLTFTGTDPDGNQLTCQVQIDTVNTFDSQVGV